MQVIFIEETVIFCLVASVQTLRHEWPYEEHKSSSRHSFFFITDKPKPAPARTINIINIK